MRSWGARLLALAVVAGIGLWVWFQGPEPAGRGQAGAVEGRRVAVAVETAPVQVDTIREVRSFTGTLHPIAQFDVAPKIGGRLSRLMVDLGDRVERGQVIARLSDAEFVQEVAQAQAELEVARAQVEEARSSLESSRREFERIQHLRRRNLVAESQFDLARSEVQAQEARMKVAQAQVSQREAALRAAQVRLSYTVIRADWEGQDAVRVVGERFVDEGATLSANTPVISVINICGLRAVVFAAERDYPRLRVGQPAQVSADGLPGQRFPAEVVRIAPRFREASRQARVELRVPNEDQKLKPGMFVRVQVQLAQADDAVVVPIEAVVNRNQQTGVFRVTDGAEGPLAQFIPVTLGIVERGRVQIVEPVVEGRVVTLGQHLLDDGTPLRLADVEAG